MPGAAYGLHPDAGQVFSPTADNRNGKGTRGGKGRSSRGGSNGTSNGKKKTVQQGMETNVQRTVYICDIDQQVTEEQLANVFADCGAVIDCRVCGDPNSAMRFAFIEFTTKESAAKVVYLSHVWVLDRQSSRTMHAGHQQDGNCAGAVPPSSLALEDGHCARQQRVFASHGRGA